jgi:methionyl-tRNA formyltransferase
MGQLDFSKNAEELFYLWKWLTPWPGIWTTYENKRLVIDKCDFLPEILEYEVGEAIRIRGQIGIQCGSWVILLGQVKLEGKKSLPVKDFINGHPGFVGSILK